jgi:hypothetical protein
LTKSKNIAVVGNGLIGKRLQQFVNANYVFDSKTLLDVPLHEYHTVYVAAPSGNRIWASENPDLDSASTGLLIRTLLILKCQRIVLISTGDTQVRPDTGYGKNRLELENAIRGRFSNHYVIRLPGLIGNDITKNILYDIKHKTEWATKINGLTKQQWYPLDNLEQDITSILSNDKREVNLVSEPILTQDIVDEFDQPTVNTTALGINYNLRPYKYTKEEIFDQISLYLRG